MKNFSLLFVLLLATTLPACTAEPESDDIDETKLQTKFEYKQTMPNGKDLVDETRGKEVWLAVGAITGLEGTPANGVVQSHYFSDGTYQHGMQININQAEPGYFYEGWLVHPVTKDFISTGRIRVLLNDVRHTLQYEIKQDYREYTNVVVTLEPDDNDPAPAVHVAEAVLKPVER